MSDDLVKRLRASHEMTRLAYIAAPYSSPSPELMQARANQAMAFMAWLWREGICYPVSPVAMWHEPAKMCQLPTDAASWTACNRAYFTACDVMYLLKLDGWDVSVGVEMELKWAQDRRMTVIGATIADGGYKLEGS